MPAFNVGDFVEYNCRGIKAMRQFDYLNGSIGVVVGIADLWSKSHRAPEHQNYFVRWLIRLGSNDGFNEIQLDETYDGARGYPDYLLKPIEAAKGELT
jgi:hypothetical protein